MANWKVVRREINGDNIIEMKYAEFGKGKWKVRKWEIFWNGVKAGYAVNEADAEVNFRRVLIGWLRDPQTGTYEMRAERS